MPVTTAGICSLGRAWRRNNEVVRLIDGVLQGADRCPQCQVSNPLLTIVYTPSHQRVDGNVLWCYATLICSKCNQQALYYGFAHCDDVGRDGQVSNLFITTSWPSSKYADDALPEKAKRFLNQALESLHAPDGAVMLAASSVDVMLKDKGYTAGSLYSRIEKANESGLLTTQMREWAHEIRLSANEPRHADNQFEGATSAEAKQVIQFAEALGEYLYVLPARVKKWQALAVEGQA